MPFAIAAAPICFALIPRVFIIPFAQGLKDRKFNGVARNVFSFAFEVRELEKTIEEYERATLRGRQQMDSYDVALGNLEEQVHQWSTNPELKARVLKRLGN